MVKYLVLEIIFDFRWKFLAYVKKECKFLPILSSASIHIKLSRTHLICCHCTEPRITHSSVLYLQLPCRLKFQVKTRSTRAKSNHSSDRQVYSWGRQWLHTNLTRFRPSSEIAQNESWQIVWFNFQNLLASSLIMEDESKLVRFYFGNFR